MKITKIGCSGTYLIGISNFKKYWVEGDLEEGENEIEAIDQLEKKLDELYTRNHVDNKGVTERVIQIEKLTDETQVTLEGINNSKDIAELDTFFPISKSNLVLSKAYQNKKKQFSNVK